MVQGMIRKKWLFQKTGLCLLFFGFSAITSIVTCIYLQKPLSGELWLYVVLGTLLCIAGSYGLERMDGLLEKRETRPKIFVLSWNKKSVLLGTVLLGIVFFAYLCIFYPGTANWDTVNVILDYQNHAEPLPYSWIQGQTEIAYFLNNHHPVFDTFVFMFFINIGKKLVDATFGFFLYCFVQSMVSAFLFSVSICWLEKVHVNIQVRRISYVFLLVFPFVAMSVICMLKDSLYSLFFLAYFLIYISMILEGYSKRKMVGLILCSLFMALTKNTGLYLVLLANTALFFQIGIRKHWKPLATSVLLPFCFVSVFMPKVLFPAMNIYPGGPQESIGFCLQHIAKVTLDHDEELTEEQKEIIDRVIPYDKIAKVYDYHNVDGIKNYYRFDCKQEDLSVFKKLWLQLLFKYPKSYVIATIGTSGGYFTPTKSIEPYVSIPNNIEHIRNSDKMEFGKRALFAYEDLLIKLPIINIFYKLVTYGCWVPLLSLFFFIKHGNQKYILCYVPILLSILVQLVCPLSYYRYIIPMIYVTPILLGLMNRKEKKNETISNRCKRAAWL